MDFFHITTAKVTRCDERPTSLPAEGFLWIDVTRDDVTANVEAWRDEIARLTGVTIFDLHLSDVINPTHSSYFDSTHDYDMIVFRNLALSSAATSESSAVRPSDSDNKDPSGRIPQALKKLVTQPVAFIVADQVLITIHAQEARTIHAARTKLLDYRHHVNGSSIRNGRLPASPQEWMLRMLNLMVDQYLDLRQPLTVQIDRWQRALLNPRRPFNDWIALLDARIALRKLDHLCEEQHDALQELRDQFVDTFRVTENDGAKEHLLVRINDVIEHVSRVLNHARRLESSLESAVQIHFSAMSHRTSEIMRTLTVITALFMPLTLITGIFGMNFELMPLLKNKEGFWLTMGGMAVIVVGLLLFFRRKRYLDE